MVKSLKRILSMVIALVMILGMIPTNALHVHAAEVNDPQNATAVGDTLVVKGDDSTPANPTNVPGTHWEFVSKSNDPTCGTDIHVHDAGCYYKTCDHKDGHLSTCYESSTAYEVCPDKDNHTHTNTANLADVVTIKVNNVTWVTTHPAYPAVYAIYKAAYDATAPGKYTGTLPQKIAGVAAISNLTVCYTTTSDPTLCTHTCSELGGSCYLKTCIKTEHPAHDDVKCYSYTWKLVYNTLAPIEVVFEGNTPGVTVKSQLPAEAKYNDSITFTLSATGDAYHTWTATINGKDPVQLSTTELTEVTAKNITSGTIKVVLTSEAVPTYTITVVEVNKLNGCAYTLNKNSNLLEGNTAELTTVIPADTDSFKFTPSVTVSGAGASYANGVVTVGTENVTVTIDYQPKKLVVNNSSEASPVEIPYNFGKGIAAQENAVKEAIFNALVNSGSSLPAGLTSWEQLGYQYYQQNKVTGSYASEGKPFTEGGTLQYEFAEIGGTNYGYVRNTAVEKIKIIWAEGNGLPEVFADVYVKLVDSRPAGVITVDNAAIGNITADEESQITEAAIRAALGNAISADLLSKLTVTIGQINLVPNGTPALATTGSVSVTLTLPGTADYKETTKVVTIPVVNPVYNPSLVLNNTNCVIKVYADANCTVEVTEFNAVAPGTYYVKVVSVATGYSAAVPTIDEGTLALQTNGSYSFAVEAADLAANVKTYTLTAAATKNSYTVTWMPNGGNWNGSTDNKVDTVEFEGTVTQPATPTKEGYTFAGWEPTVVTTMGAANVEYVAKWTVNQYTISFDSKGGPAVGSITENFGEEITLPTPGVWTGYTFLGWYTDAELNNKFVGTTMPLNGATLYAKWTADASSITFDTNGGSAVEAITGNFGDAVAAPINPTKTGYTFVGWFTAEQMDNQDFDTPYQFTTLPATAITLYAKWTPISYGITWNWGDGAALVTYSSSGEPWNYELSDKADYNSNISFMFSVTRAGYTFKGLTLYKADGVTKIADIALGTYSQLPEGAYKAEFNMPAEDVVVVANWEINKYTITFVDEDGTTVLGSYVVAYGAMPTIPADPTKADTAEWDYTFAGWDNQVVAVTGDTTYRATYSAVKQEYTIVWIVNGVEQTTTAKYGELPVAPAYTVPAYHEFVKWDITPDTVTGEAVYAAVLTLKTNSTPTINKSDYNTENLKDKVLAAAGLPKTGNYTITTQVGVELPLVGLQTVTVIINNDGVTLQQQRADYDIAQIFAMALTDDTSRTFAITDNDTGVSKSVTVAVVEDRYDTAYTVGKNDFTVNADTVIDETWLNSNLGINVPSGQGYSVAVVGAVPTFVAGNTYTVTVKIAIVENNEYKGLTEEFDITIRVNDAFVNITGSENITYNLEMSVEDITKYILENLTVLYNPQALKDMPHSIKYLANEATTVPVTVNLKNLDLGPYASLIPYDTITVDIPVAALWLDIGAAYPETTAPSNEKLEGIFNELITKYGADIVLGRVDIETLKFEFKAILDADKDLKLYYQYLAAHEFGAQSNETIKIIVNGGEEHGLVESNTHVIDLTDTRSATEIKLNSGVSVVYGQYTKESLLALILDGVYANGTKLDVTVEFVTDVIGLPASESCEITVKFKGDADYKPCTATTTIVINKASVNVSVDNRLFKWQAGQFYGINDVVSTSPAGVDTINFVAGLNLNGVNIDGGIKGFVAQVQLLLPEELQALLESANGLLQAAGLDISFADGASMKLSDLKAAVDALKGITTGSEYEEYFRVLLNMLSSLPTDVADIEIIIGGKMPTDIGVYAVGAISADANYTTDFGVGAVVIYPDGTKVDLAWNQNDENYIITNTLLSSGAFDTGAHATKVYDDRFTLEQATAQVGEIFLGVDIDGNITFETNQAKLNVGAYIEIATVVNFGNEMFYAVPLVRPLVVIAETLDVDFVDASGAVNNERHYEFFNVPQNGMEGNLLVTYKQDGNGYKAGDKATGYAVKYFYVGVQTNGYPYASTTAPVHAGVYTITAMVTVRDNTGYITHAGQGIGALVIEPSKSTIKVENEAIKWDGNAHTFNQYVTAGSVNVPTITPDSTIITAGVSADLDANIGLRAINGTVNVDMPIWLDSLMNKLGLLEAGYADGITVAQFKSYVEKIKAGLAELGFESEAFDKIVSVINQLDGKVVLTFHDNKGYEEVGVYLVIGIVTDSDHYPSVDAGLVVIYPDAEKVDLQFNKTWDNNNVFTWKYLQTYDLNAKAYKAGTDIEIPAATDKVVNLFVGFADHGELVFTNNKSQLDNGVYAQVAFVWDLSNKPYYAEPISREVVIVPNNATIDFVDENGNVNNDRLFQFNANSHAMQTIRVTLVDGRVLTLTAEDSRVTIFYAGVQSNGKPYASYDAPTHTGVYEVTAQFTERDAEDRVINLGVGIGALVIEPSKATVEVENEAIKRDGNAHTVNGLVNAGSVNVPGLKPDTTILSVGISADLDANIGWDAIKGNVNVDMPAWMDEVLKELGVLEAGFTGTGVNADIFLSYVQKVEAELAAKGIESVAFNKLVDVIKQLPSETVLTFHDNIGYKDVGAYLVVGVVTDFNHYPAVDAGVLVIYPAVEKGELKWNYTDDNAIFTLPALSNIDMSATAYLNGVVSKEDTNKIHYLTVGVTENGKVVLTATPDSITSNGAYTQVAYIPLLLDSQITVAAPIIRSFVVVPQTATVIVTDTEAIYNKDYQVPVSVVQMNNQSVTDERLEKYLELTYIGVDASAGMYNSNVKPTNVGVYTVIATYIERDVNGELNYIGMNVGTLTIVPGDAEYDLNDKTVVNGTADAVDSMVSNTDNLPYAIYVIRNTAKGEVNVILPAGWEVSVPVGAGVDALITAIEKLPAATENTKLVQALKSALNNVEMQTLTVNGAQPSSCGEYDVVAIAFGDVNYDVATASAKLTVDHAGDADKDHLCDDCGENLYGTCEDTDKDHACDYGCDKVFGDCEDTDKDHACDYGCDKVFGTCEDTDKDHACDYGCDKVFGDCVDTDKDHACDYGCDKVFGTCEDTDKDHACDYGCDKVFGTCEDTDKDHACDYGCDKVFGDCEDTDKDHACDYGCDKVFGIHSDDPADGDHACDYGCGEDASDCVDYDDDRKCDDCGAKVGKYATPTIGIPTLDGNNIYGFEVDYESKRIYIDTVKTGLTIEQFLQQLEVSVFNDTDDKAEISVSYLTGFLTGAELIRTSAKVSFTAENEDGKTTVTYDVVVIGDVNCNGEIDSGDASLIQRYFFNEAELTALQIDAADTNRSGEVESGDAVKNQVKYNEASRYQSNLHSYTVYTPNQDADCGVDGTMTLTCTANHICNAHSVIVPEAGSAKRHNYVLKEGAYVCDLCEKNYAPNV